MKQDFWFNMYCSNVNSDWMKVYIIQRKSGIMINIGVSVRN